MGSLSAHERFRREVAASDCFAKLAAGWSDLVEVIEGDLEQPGLGLAVGLSDSIGTRVTHVVHAAASIEFDLPIADAARAKTQQACTVAFCSDQLLLVESGRAVFWVADRQGLATRGVYFGQRTANNDPRLYCSS